MFEQEIFDWVLLLGRWLHITVAVTWIGTSIFFMWLDRSFEKIEDNGDGHVGDLWMVHGGGFYKVEKRLMGPTKVPSILHWFKWESYWTWMSGMFLLVLTYYTGGGTYLLDSTVSAITFPWALALCGFSIFGSWFFYDLLWEIPPTKKAPIIGHVLTALWFMVMTIVLCKVLSGRAAYIHIGAMLGTWMAGNVFMRIIPRQLKMVEASKKGEPVNQEWGKNAKNRSTHNTYFTLPIIFIMLSNHFPNTYGHDLNWLALIMLTVSGGLIRQFFVIRESKEIASKLCAVFGVLILILTMVLTNESGLFKGSAQRKAPLKLSKMEHDAHKHKKVIKSLKTNHSEVAAVATPDSEKVKATVKGVITFVGTPKKGTKLRLPSGCSDQYEGDVYTDEVKLSDDKLQNVFVRISSGLENRIYNEVPPVAVEVDQLGCIYRPRVVAAMVNQEVVFINSDPIFHNVKSITKKNKRFNLAMPKKDQRESRFFDTPELFVETRCSVHPWMSAFIAVMDHPYFDVTREKGTFELKNVPAGKFTLEVWHEVYGTQKEDFEITTDGEIKVINFTYRG